MAAKCGGLRLQSTHNLLTSCQSLLQPSVTYNMSQRTFGYVKACHLYPFYRKSHHSTSIKNPPIPNILEETLPTHSQNLCGVSNEYFCLRRTVSIKLQPKTYLHYNTNFNINTTTLTDTCVISTLIKFHTFSPTSKTIHHQARAKQMRDDATMCRIELFLDKNKYNIIS